MTNKKLPVIALLAAPETSASVLFGLYDVLLSVGSVFGDMTTGQPGDALLDIRIVAEGTDPFRCVGGVLVEPHADLGDGSGVDVAIVCDMYTPIDVPPRGHHAREVDWLRRVHASGALVASVCTGSLMLAEAGLLDGREASCHWAYRDLFREHYPRVRMTEDSILNLASEADGVVTAGGVTAWQDLALYLIARLCGPKEAVRTAKVFLLAGHEDGQRPFAAMTRPGQTRDAVIAQCQTWIEGNYGVANPVGAMIDRSGLTPRTFGRRFRAATGYLPIEYVHAVRIEEARAILESGSAPTETVGYDVGYEDPSFFRRLFKRTTGMSPAAYRRKMAGIVADAGEPTARRFG
ncbi:MAG: helix-turn-helix domain-containing protein [Chloroflexota bacterium]